MGGGGESPDSQTSLKWVRDEWGEPSAKLIFENTNDCRQPLIDQQATKGQGLHFFCCSPKLVAEGWFEMPHIPRQKTAIYKTNYTVKKTRWRTRTDDDHGQGHHLFTDTANTQLSVLIFSLTHTNTHLITHRRHSKHRGPLEKDGGWHTLPFPNGRSPIPPHPAQGARVTEGLAHTGSSCLAG